MNKFKDKSLRSPIVEGIFYPSGKEELHNLISSYTKGKEKGNASFIVSPHAGYNVAGQLMTDAFMSAAARDIKEIVIISPVHREESDKIILPYFKSFYTSAGDIPVNMKSLHMFMSTEDSIVRDDIPHLEEHAIEVQLPIISNLFPDVSILPVLLGKTTINMVKKLTKALVRAYGQKMNETLFVITSNLSVYEKENDALLKAERALQLFEKGNWREISEEKRQNLIDACGAGVLASVLNLFDAPLSMDILSRSCSEGKESEKGKIVSYGALSFKEIKINGSIN